MVVIERQKHNAVRKDRVFNSVTTTNVSKIPLWDSLSAVGDESGMVGDIIIDKSSSSFCFHNGTQWLCVSGGSGGGNSPWTVSSPNFIQNVAYPDAPVSFGGNNLLFGSAVLDSTQGANGTRMLFIADSATPTAGIGSLRAGTTSGPEWDAANRGDNSVAFGVDNVASGVRAFIGSGKYNTASGLDTVVCGGVGNSATGQNAVIVGGVANSVSGKFSGILSGGRYLNTPPYTFYGNTVTSNYSCIGAGYANTISIDANQNGKTSFIGAGNNNINIGSRNLIGAGRYNLVSGQDTAIVGGALNNIKGYFCFIGAGSSNTVSANNSTIIGGSLNSISNVYCFIGTGYKNTVTNQHAAIVSGTLNTASAKYSFIGGGGNNYTFQGALPTNGYSFIGAGFFNTASESTVFIGAGQFNTATAKESFIGGGGFNIANNLHATIVGGFQNSASGSYSFIGSGRTNIVLGNISSVVGGQSNTISNGADYSGIVSGKRNTISSGKQSSFIGSGAQNTIANSYTVICGGVQNSASAKFSFIGGGLFNRTIQGLNEFYGYSFIGGGYNNTVTERTAFIGAGLYNTATAKETFIGGGGGNIASAVHATIVGGFLNTVNREYSFIGAGIKNTVSNRNAAIVDGFLNTATGAYSFIGAGDMNTVNGTRSFIGAGNQNSNFADYSGILIGQQNTIINGSPENVVNSSITAGNNLQLDQRDTTMTQNLRVGDITKNNDAFSVSTGGVQFQSTRVFTTPAVMPNIYQLNFEDHTVIIQPGSSITDITVYLPNDPIQGQRYYAFLIPGVNGGIIASMSPNIFNTLLNSLVSSFDMTTKRGVIIIYANDRWFLF